MHVLFMMIVLAQPPQAPPVDGWIPPQAPPVEVVRLIPPQAPPVEKGTCNGNCQCATGVCTCNVTGICTCGAGCTCKGKLQVTLANTPQAPPVMPNYADALRAAVKDGRSVAVFIGVEVRPIDGLTTLSRPTLTGSPSRSIFVSVPDGKGWMTGFDISATSTDAEILSAVSKLQERKVQPLASPFYAPAISSNPSRNRSLEASAGADLAVVDAAQIADDDKAAVGRWPKNAIPFPTEATRYKRTEYTQRIAVTNGVDSIGKMHESRRYDSIMGENPNYANEKYIAPGGLAYVKGWRSDLYKYIPGGKPRAWLDNIAVKNSFDQYQWNRGYVRSYPDGTYFMDCLSVGGKAFEVRVGEKVNGKWQFYTAFKDASSRPAGYNGLNGRKCGECHKTDGIDGPGSGSYGPLVRGSDAIFSDPIHEVMIRPDH